MGVTAKVVTPAFVAALLVIPVTSPASPPEARSSPVGVAKLELRERAQKAYDANDWASAAEAYAQVVEQNSADGGAWLRLGRARQHLRQYPGAMAAYQHGVALGFTDAARGDYALAVMAAQAGESDASLAWLKKALDGGYPDRMDIAGDEAFGQLARDPRFQALVNPPTPPSADRVTGWLTDLDYLTAEIQRVHYVYRQQPMSQAYRDGAETFRAGIATMSDAEATLGLQRLVASLGNGHSLIYPVGMDHGRLQVLPLQWYWFDDGLFILSSGEDAEKLVGRKVLKIGELTPAEALRRARPYISRDNDEELLWVGPSYLTLTDVLKAIGAATRTGSVVLTLQESGGRTSKYEAVVKSTPAVEEDFKVSLPPLPHGPNPLHLSHPDKNYWFQDLPGGIVYFQFNHVLNAADESMDAFAVRLKAALNRGSVHGLIIDVRHNNGGNASLIPGLLKTLVWFEREKGEGSMAAIIGRNTFSAAQDFTNYLGMMTDAVFVGEPTSSKPVSIGDEAMFRLPYSGIVGSIATYIHHDAISRDARVWIAPDIPSALSYADYVAGRDPSLETAQAVLARRH